MHIVIGAIYLWALYKWPRQVFMGTALFCIGILYLITTDKPSMSNVSASPRTYTADELLALPPYPEANQPAAPNRIVAPPKPAARPRERTY